MTEQIVLGPRKPAVVVLAATLNFITTALCTAFGLLTLATLVFGQSSGLFARAASDLRSEIPSQTLSMGVGFVLFGVMCVSWTMAVCFAFVGVGLIRRAKIAWYAQIAMSVVGLLGFPVYTILNACLLVLLFRPATRDYFGE